MQTNTQQIFQPVPDSPVYFIPAQTLQALWWNKWSRKSFTGSVMQKCTACILLCLQHLLLPGRDQPWQRQCLKAEEFERVQNGFGRLQTCTAHQLCSSSHYATGSITSGHIFTSKGCQCPVFTQAGSCMAVTHLPATEYAQNLTSNFSVSNSPRKSQFWFLAIVSNTFAVIREPFWLLAAPHLCHHIHTIQFELSPYNLAEIWVLLTARNSGERRSKSCHKASFCMHIE